MIETKEILAKLLATENLTVVQKDVETASFDVENRVLSLPLWDNMDEFTYDHLTGHEVGHALYTPLEGLKEVTKRGKGFKSFVNVIEDARIEKMIQARYPGLRRSFIKSYNKMLDDGFFGKTKEEINNYRLIDRINVFFKCGYGANIKFTKEEKTWVNEVDGVRTWDDVIRVAEKLYGLAEEEREEENKLKEELKAEMEREIEAEGENDEYDFSDCDDSDGDYGNDEISGTSEGESEEEVNEESSSNGKGAGSYSETDELLNRNIEKEYSNKNNGSLRVSNLELKIDYAERNVVPYKEIVELYKQPAYSGTISFGKDLFDKFMKNNRSVINYMVKEFEMKKRAAEYKRTSLAKTGVIDPVKMNSYKYCDDIFRKMEVTPDGKNHGLIMYVDWSGSMANDLAPTMDQLMNMVMFCRKVNIPFRVFAFSDVYNRYVIEKTGYMMEENKLEACSSLSLIELFSNKMKTADFNFMTAVALGTASYFDRSRRYDYVGGRAIDNPIWIPSLMHLGGTPLNDAIVAAIPVHNRFKKENRLDIVTTVFLTDGDSNGKNLSNDVLIRGFSECCRITVTDPETKKTYRMPTLDVYSPYRRLAETNFLLKLYRENTKSNTIGYRILPYNKRSFMYNLGPYVGDFNTIDSINLYENLKKDKFVCIPNSGYTEFFGIAGGKNLKTANTNIEVAEDAKKGAITRAFKKANGNRKETRVMLTKFIELVA